MTGTYWKKKTSVKPKKLLFSVGSTIEPSSDSDLKQRMKDPWRDEISGVPAHPRMVDIAVGVAATQEMGSRGETLDRLLK